MAKKGLGKPMKDATAIEECINKIFSEWNPIGVPEMIAIDEYRDYVNKVISIGRDKAKIRQYLIFVLEYMGLDYNENIKEQKNDIDDVAEKLMHAMSEK